MKKTYINPSMEVIKIASQGQMLTGSNTIPMGESGSANNAEGRYFGDDWEDEDF